VAVSGGEVHAIILLSLCVLLLRGGSGDRERIILVIDTARIAGGPRESRRGIIVRAASL